MLSPQCQGKHTRATNQVLVRACSGGWRVGSCVLFFRFQFSPLAAIHTTHGSAHRPIAKVTRNSEDWTSCGIPLSFKQLRVHAENMDISEVSPTVCSVLLFTFSYVCVAPLRVLSTKVQLTLVCMRCSATRVKHGPMKIAGQMPSTCQTHLQ